MDEQLLKQSRKFKRDNNMKQEEHGVCVVDYSVRLERRYSGNEYYNGYVSLIFPFYMATIKQIQDWLNASFPEIKKKIGQYKWNSLQICEFGHAKADKHGNAPVLLKVRISGDQSLGILGELNEDRIQQWFDEAYQLSP